MESQRNFTNTTVLGGLDKYLRRWAGDTITRLNSPELLSRFNELHLADSDYASWGLDKRKSWMKDVLDWLSQADKLAGAVREKKVELAPPWSAVKKAALR